MWLLSIPVLLAGAIYIVVAASWASAIVMLAITVPITFTRYRWQVRRERES